MSRPLRGFTGAAGRIAAGTLLASTTLMTAVGCGSGTATPTASAGGSTEPSYVAAPFTHEEQLVERGARLYVSDGCSACHSIGSRRGSLGPSFAVLAGNRVTLTDGRRALVDERFLREALVDPARVEVRGYAPGPMLGAVRRLGLARDPAAVAALAAFIEQIGPETP
jgi:mono/diheme cytochrome c family protein